MSETESKFLDIGIQFTDTRSACDKLSEIGGNHNTNLTIKITLENFLKNYTKWLPKKDKQLIEPNLVVILEKGSNAKKGYDHARSLQNY